MQIYTLDAGLLIVKSENDLDQAPLGADQTTGQSAQSSKPLVKSLSTMNPTILTARESQDRVQSYHNVAIIYSYHVLHFTSGHKLQVSRSQPSPPSLGRLQ